MINNILLIGDYILMVHLYNIFRAIYVEIEKQKNSKPESNPVKKNQLTREGKNAIKNQNSHYEYIKTSPENHQTGEST